MPKIEILEEYCKGCGLCVQYCPAGAIRIATRISSSGINPVEVVDETKCVGCENCVVMCPDAAILLYKEVKVKTK